MVSKTIFIPAPTTDAYLEWKSFLGLGGQEPGTGSGCNVIEDIPDRGMHWLSRWGMAQIDGRVDFIPADGGCVLYFNVDGVGVVSRLILSTGNPMERDLLQYVGKFGNVDGANGAGQPQKG